MYHVDIENNPDSSFTVKSRDYEFIIDINGKGITPPDTLLASIGSCIGVYIHKYAQGSKLALDKFKISIDAEFCAEKPVRFKTINVSIDLNGIVLNERRKKAFLEFIKNCPVHNTLKNNPDLEINIL